ncbi:MAG: ZIP family metal transporter [Betaproteobacteria bacterium]|nr:ZIP family metal transporter [Betaproteobacteria bacterium]
MTLLQILLATLAGGVLSVLAAALVSLTLLSQWAPRLVAYAVGVLLGAAFLHLLPEAIEAVGPQEVLATCLGGLLAFFVLEKLTLWRHAHAGLHEHGHAHKPAGTMILVGDALHNFVDGILIAAAFLTEPELGWVVAIGIIAHEIPQETGDFMVLLASGWSRRSALGWNLLASLAAVAGGLLGYFALSGAEAAVPYVLAVSAASFLYIAVADLIPELHRHWRLPEAGAQLALIAAGVATPVLLHSH